MGVACSCQTVVEDQSTELVSCAKPDGATSELKEKDRQESPSVSDASTKAAREESQALSSSFHLEKVDTEKEEAILEQLDGSDSTKMLSEIRKAIQEQDFSTARDISKPTAKVLCVHKTNPPSDLVLMSITSKDQVPTIPLLEVKDDKIVCGTIPTIWALPHWPMWFPFCESNKVLRRLSPSCFVINCTLKVLFLRIDFILFVDIADKLHTSEECLEILMRSPPPGSEGQQWMGVTIPPKCGSLPRICLINSALRLKPTAMDQFQVDLQMELDDPAGAPQWVKTFIFQQLAIRIIPELCKFQSKIPGSALDKFLNGRHGADAGAEVIDQEGLDYIFNLQRSIENYVTSKTSDSTWSSGDRAVIAQMHSQSQLKQDKSRTGS